MKNKVEKNIIIWTVPKFSTEWWREMHWCDLATINDELRFKMFCQILDKKCFVEDLKNNLIIEFSGAKAQGIKIINSILEKENKNTSSFTSQEILDEMDRDMEDSGIAQGEIVSNLNHWRNKYLITKREK